MNKVSKWQPVIALVTASSLLIPSMMPTHTALAQIEPRVTPAKVTAALPELEKLANKIIADGDVPGLSIAVVYKDEVVYLKGFGVKKIGDDSAGEGNQVDEDTVFQLASMSKPIASTIVAALVSKGVASWDSRISDLDPAFQLSDPLASRDVTVRDLFSHRSGLPGNAGNELEGMGYSRDEILHRLRYAAPASSFRSGYSYSNFGITEGAVAAAKPTGQAWEDVAEALLYKPLGMTSTSSRYTDFLTRTNRATLHSEADGKWASLVKREPDAQSPAGGVSSSARDLAQWMRLELGNGKYNGEQLISEAAIAQTHLPTIMRGPNPITGQPSFYALGWNVDYELDGSVRWGHAGAFSVGARTLVSLNGVDQIGIVVLSNAFPTGVPEALASSLFDLVYTGKIQRDWVKTWNDGYDSIYGPKAIAAGAAPYAKKPASPSSALKAEAYVGSYANNYVDARVVAGSDGLVLQLGPKQKPYPLTHFNRDLFLYYADAEYPNVPSPVSFIIGVDGTATQLQLDDLANVKQSVLPRIADAQAAAPVFSDSLKQEMDAEIEKQMKDNNLPSVAASIVIPGQAEYSFVKGTANLETGRPRKFDDPFRIASNTKTFIGLTILRLVDEGKLSTDDTIDTWFPDFPNAGKITVGDLLRMRSGIPDPFDEAGLADYYAHPLMIQTAEDSIAKAAKDPSKFQEPDQITHYVNVNFILLAVIAEKITKQPIDVAVHEQVLVPLELTHTLYPTNTVLPGELRGYSWEADTETFRDMTVLNPGVAGGAGAMISDIRDLETYVRALCTGTLLKPETHAAQMQGQLLDGKGIVNYGEALGFFGKFCGHTGTIFGFTTYMMYLPERDATVIINVNRLDEDDQSSATAIFLAITKLAFPNDVSW